MSEVLALREREKELRCLYRVSEIVAARNEGIESAFEQVLAAIPFGWQRPDQTAARISYFGRDYVGTGFIESAANLAKPLRLWGVPVGSIEVSHRVEEQELEISTFLDEEAVLLASISDRLSGFLEWKQTELLGLRVPARPEHWQWREEQAKMIATRLDARAYGVEALYLGGSTHHGTAGPASDIDLFVVFRGDDTQRRELAAWFEGWSNCLAEIAYRRTGYAFEHGLLDIQWLAEKPGLWGGIEMRALTLNLD